MINSRRLLIALFLMAFLLTLLITLPASFLGTGINKASQGRLELANCKGTFWHGSATPILHRSGSEASILPLNPLQWDVSAVSLLSLQPRFSLNWVDDKQAAPVELSTSLQQLNIKNLYLPLPASLLGELSAYLRPIELGGRIIVKSDSLIVTSRKLQGTIIADWLGANSALSNISPLGDYRLIVKGTGTGADLSLDTTSGKLILKGSGHVDASGTVNFSGHAEAAEGQQAKLGELLRNLGPETAPGQHGFSLITN